MKKMLQNTLFAFLALTLFPNTVFSQTFLNVEFSVLGQQYGVFELDYFIISTAPGGVGILVDGETPTSSTTGQLIYRMNADKLKTWGPIGAFSTRPFGP